LAVVPTQQRTGIGARLVAGGLEACGTTAYGVVVVVLGQLEYYPRRFGFMTAKPPHGVAWEHKAPEEAFMIRELKTGALLAHNKDIAQLGQSLKWNTTLETLHWWNNKVTDSGARTFAETIPSLHGLKKLYVGDNPSGKEGTRYLLRALDLNDALQYVGLPRFS
jgi:hypothetical protein